MPKLRKEKKYIESNISTQLQKFLTEFLYEQQDIYTFYDNQLKEGKQVKNLCKLTEKIKIKSNNKVFEFLLENLSQTVSEFTKEDIDELKKLRWYLKDFQENEPPQIL